MLRGMRRRQTIRGRFRVRCVCSAVVSLGFFGSCGCLSRVFSCFAFGKSSFLFFFVSNVSWRVCSRVLGLVPGHENDF